MKEPHYRLQRWWGAITLLITIAIFTQALFAGAILSGVDFAYAAHKATAAILIASSLAAGLVATITLRTVLNGLKFGVTLLLLAVVIIVQTMLGKLSAEGANLMWVHVPLGVALVGLAMQAVIGARKLGDDGHAVTAERITKNPARKLWSI